MQTPTIFTNSLLKATPKTEGGKRFVYIEASNEARDMQGEVVLAKALAESKDYYLKYGNLDLDHLSQIKLQKGEPDYLQFEVGRPIQVNIAKGNTFVKGEIFTGDSTVAKCANDFWESLTELNPPQVWYPSIGGQVLQREKLANKTVVGSVRWTNIGFSKTPVNTAVGKVSTITMQALHKAWGAHGLDLKALDTATGGALLKQSLDHEIKDYFDFRNVISGCLKKGQVQPKKPEHLKDFAERHLGVPEGLAAEWTVRFLTDLKNRNAQ